jgi:hypothetical protein
MMFCPRCGSETKRQGWTGMCQSCVGHFRGIKQSGDFRAKHVERARNHALASTVSGSAVRRRNIPVTLAGSQKVTP